MQKSLVQPITETVRTPIPVERPRDQVNNESSNPTYARPSATPAYVEPLRTPNPVRTSTPSYSSPSRTTTPVRTTTPSHSSPSRTTTPSQTTTPVRTPTPSRTTTPPHVRHHQDHPTSHLNQILLIITEILTKKGQVNPVSNDER